MSTQLDKFLITAMDRFVWFILLVVISHLVTQYTNTNGYTTNGDRYSLIPFNKSVLINAMEVPQLTQFPNHNLDTILMKPTNEATSSNSEEKTFSLRPIIDGIFEIPLSALNAVNRLVQRLTGNFYAHPTSAFSENSPLKEKNT